MYFLVKLLNFLNCIHNSSKKIVKPLTIKISLQVTDKNIAQTVCQFHLSETYVVFIIISCFCTLTGPNFIALIDGKQICVLTVAEKFAQALAYFTG